jgi:peptidoglycan/xylan/chitin deacetylase (PgdA/CDA1 family)
LPLSAVANVVKSGIFAVGQSTGVFRLLRNSRWRSGRLLVLCYHGVSQDDEHEALDELFISADLFRKRLLALRSADYQVLSLNDGLKRLATNTLPPRSVVLTFDDGFVDFYRVVAPILREFGYPATVYVSTEYVQNQFPVFPGILTYILWKARGREASGAGLLLDDMPIQTGSADQRFATQARLIAAARERGPMNPPQCDDLAAAVSERLQVDYAEIKARRLLHLMTEEEIGQLDRGLVDVQLHTHHHTQPRDRQLFRREIEENRQTLTASGISPSGLRHFCYPNGEVREELPEWLRQLGIESATTCAPGIADNRCDPLLIPRFVDTQFVGRLKFEAWACGAAALLPQRR